MTSEGTDPEGAKSSVTSLTLRACGLVEVLTSHSLLQGSLTIHECGKSISSAAAPASIRLGTASSPVIKRAQCVFTSSRDVWVAEGKGKKILGQGDPPCPPAVIPD